MATSLVSRLIRVINVIVALVLVAVLFLVYRYAWKPLPDRSGTIDAAVAAPARIDFDERGVPHIRAASQADALFLQGYVTAQDRLFQMDILRRFTAGDLSEVFGSGTLQADRDARGLRLRRIAENAYTTLPAADRADLAAYTRGVNEFLATHRGSLPLEFTLAGYEPRPWSVVDCLLISLSMIRNLTNSWNDELVKQQLLEGGDPAKVAVLLPKRAGTEFQPGSNAWALAGRYTASGKPLLSNDMHLEYSLPGIWYMVHLTAPGLDVSGVALPGAPGVIVGHNQRIAWGITNLHFDVQDLYAEKIDDRSGRYLYRGQAEPLRIETETIRVKGQQPVDVRVLVTRHGPITVNDGKQLLALRWTAAEPGMLQYPILELNRAQNWQQFTAALTRFPAPGSNLIYADVDGNIGYHAVGSLPVRRAHSGDLPVDGASGGFEWDGYIPFAELPSAFNPPGGMIVSANQNPFPENYPYTANGNFGTPYRAAQIRARLQARKDWRAQDLLSVQRDVYTAFGTFLASQAVAAAEKRKAHTPSLDSAVAILRSWDGQVMSDRAAPVLADLLFRHVRTAFGEKASPGKGPAYVDRMAPVAIEKLLRERPAGWFDDYDEMLMQALVDATDEGMRMQGRDLAKWKYAKMLTVRINHPVVHEVPVLGKYFDIGPVPMNGSALTVKQTTGSLAPSMRMNADLGDWGKSLLNIQIGQSGQVLSPHYRDQWKDYYSGRSYPMNFGGGKAAETLQFRPRAR
jgi:penicillin G amidase